MLLSSNQIMGWTPKNSFLLTGTPGDMTMTGDKISQSLLRTHGCLGLGHNNIIIVILSTEWNQEWRIEREIDFITFLVARREIPFIFQSNSTSSAGDIRHSSYLSKAHVLSEHRHRENVLPFRFRPFNSNPIISGYDVSESQTQLSHYYWFPIVWTSPELLFLLI
jgi:hypothetical protein